jgi:hypothetical protein
MSKIQLVIAPKKEIHGTMVESQLATLLSDQPVRLSARRLERSKKCVLAKQKEILNEQNILAHGRRKPEINQVSI